jgi:hypothetical protein
MPDRALAKKITVVIWIAHFVTSFATALAANFNLRSILYSGPALSLVGLLFVAVTLSRLCWSYLIFGLAAPLTCALCAILIAIFRLGPRWETGWPIAVIFVFYDIAISPLALMVLFKLRRTLQETKSPYAWRFSVKTLFILMTAVSVLCVALRVVVDLETERAVFTAFAVVTASLSAIITWRFLVERRKASPVAAVRPQ